MGGAITVVVVAVVEAVTGAEEKGRNRKNASENDQNKLGVHRASSKSESGQG